MIQKKRYGSKELRVMQVSPEERKEIRRNDVYIILDNVLDTYNIGAIFRLADAVAAKEVIITGDAEVPPNHRIKKASINTTEWVHWEYAESAARSIKDLRLKIKDLKVVAVEQAENSVSYDSVKYDFPLAFVVGHETDGVSEEVLKLCDEIVEIPMWGVNKSLNVMVSLSIVLFEAMEGK